MLPCLLALVAVAAPRLAVALVWLFGDYLGRAFDGTLFIVLGFLFLPLTTLTYAWAINTNGSLEGLYIVAVVIAVIMDLGAGGASRIRSRE